MYSVISSRMKRHIRHELSAEGPTVWIGKEGLTAQIVKEISRQLDQREMIKAKFLQTALKDTTAKEIAGQIANSMVPVNINRRNRIAFFVNYADGVSFTDAKSRGRME